VEGQRKEMPQPVVIEGEEEWEVEKIIKRERYGAGINTWYDGRDAWQKRTHGKVRRI